MHFHHSKLPHSPASSIMRHWVVKVEQKGLHVVSIHIAGIITLLLCSHTEPVSAIRNPGFLNIWFSLMRYHNTAAGTHQLKHAVHPARWLPTNWYGIILLTVGPVYCAAAALYTCTVEWKNWFDPAQCQLTS